MKNVKIALTASIVIALFSSTVLAGSNGSAPNGKPFVAIGGQIVEVKGAISSLQEQVDLLVVRADTMEGQVVNLQTAINTLRLEDANLLTLINNNTTNVEDLKFYITALEAQNVTLNTQISQAGSDVTHLQTLIQANESAIRSLQSAILSDLTSIYTSIESLQIQIDHNNQLILYLEAQLAQVREVLTAKQNIINGVCPSGQSMTRVFDTGSVQCERVASSGGMSIAVSRTFVANTYYSNPYYHTFRAQCAPGWLVTGGGFMAVNGTVVGSHPGPGESWDITTIIESVVPYDNDHGWVATLVAYANCVKIVAP